MTTVIKDLGKAPLFWALCGIVGVWSFAAFLFIPRQLIEIENTILICGGTGVVAAYSKPALHALRQRRPTRSDILATGIWFAWLSIPGERMLSLVGRYFHPDIKFFDTHLHTFLLSVTILSFLCHLLAPEAVGNRLPTRGWTRLGIIVFLAGLALSISILRSGF
jgi:hypothetical protein